MMTPPAKTTGVYQPSEFKTKMAQPVLQERKGRFLNEYYQGLLDDEHAVLTSYP